MLSVAVNIRPDFRLHCQAVQLAPLSLQQQPELAAELRHTPQYILNAGREYVLPPDNYHVVGPAVDAQWQRGISAPARAVHQVPAGDVSRRVPNHGLGTTLQMGVDWH